MQCVVCGEDAAVERQGEVSVYGLCAGHCHLSLEELNEIIAERMPRKSLLSTLFDW